jgi:hypothetical protein
MIEDAEDMSHDDDFNDLFDFYAAIELSIFGNLSPCPGS